ncbi:probable G-protein coupled receptor 139 [Amblyraja radiata]|uniref:probable G-protein coupled receptor 139 n=1 Tax=Amblyraja radiata TaxID=386614 RepID=UPI0014030783|nr:probable G-protein coupled receptor 139 [Amblyraja radiata]
MAIMILSRGKCGLSVCTTRYLVAMAAADLWSIIITVIIWRIIFYYIPGSILEVTPVCAVIAGLFLFITDCSVWFTVAFSFDRFIAICCNKWKAKYCSGKVAAAVLATVCILFCCKNVPIYFTLEAEKLVDGVPWGCPRKPSYFTEPGWVAYDCLDKVLCPLLPFALILLLNALTVRHILVANKIRKRLRGHGTEEKISDPEMENRRKSVVLLFALSGNFILLWLVYVIYFFHYVIAQIDPEHDTDSTFIFQQISFMLLTLSCCTNTFIYAVTQTKFREQLQSALKYPIITIIQLGMVRNR